MAIRGRYAPSPTGSLHLGNARTALLAWLQIRALKGTFILRIEDLDRPRTVRGATEAILSELRWLGLDWDEGPDVGGSFGSYLQSERSDLYEDALARLRAKGLVYECFCSRAEVAAAASAPHGPQDDGPRYPGTCRALSADALAARRAGRRQSALRFLVEPGTVAFEDGLKGKVEVELAQAMGDFVVRRADGLHAYQLAVAVDDALMGVTHVLRGDDLLLSTPRQLRLLEALGLAAPRYAHVPLLLDAQGHRLCKRNGDLTLSALRAQGARPERVVAALARSCGLTQESEIVARDLVSGFDLERISPTGTAVDPASLR